MHHAPADAVRVSVNEHGLKWGRCDYVVFCDQWVGERVTPFGVPRVCEFPQWADYHYEPLSDVWQPGFSSGTATWLALFMGCAPVVLAGMDCYAGQQTYWHTDGQVESSGHLWRVDSHVRAWGRGFMECPRFDQVLTMGGPLTEIFPVYDPAV